jgi:hypothetical protein
MAINQYEYEIVPGKSSESIREVRNRRNMKILGRWYCRNKGNEVLVKNRF